MKQAQADQEGAELQGLSCSRLQVEVWLLYRADKSYDEIAAELEITPLAVLKHVGRVRKRLSDARAERVALIDPGASLMDGLIETARTLRDAFGGPPPSAPQCDTLPHSSVTTLDDWVQVVRGN